MSSIPSALRSGVRFSFVFTLVASGCMVGPDYRKPPAPIAERWLDAAVPRVETDSRTPDRWWRVFDDPALDALVDTAYTQNLPLQAAGLRVIAAQARRGIAIGGLFPQVQAASGSFMRTRSSLNQFGAQGSRDFNYLLVVDDKNVVQHRRVKVGALDKGMRVIDDGIKLEDWVVVTGLQRARPGSTVKPKQVTAATSADAPKPQTAP